MKPCSHSLERLRLGLSNGWEFVGEDVKFKQSKLNDIMPVGRRPYYMLSFSYKFEHLGDKV